MTSSTSRTRIRKFTPHPGYGGFRIFFGSTSRVYYCDPAERVTALKSFLLDKHPRNRIHHA